jgi:hypothetical protein
MHHAWRQDVCAFGKYAGQFGTQEAETLADCNAALQQEGANLIDDAGALTDQPLTHPVQGLQVELLDSLGGDKSHRWALQRLGDCLGIAEIILLSLRKRTHVFCRHQPGIVTETLELATEMMRTDAGLHADQARRHVGEPCFHLATRTFLPQRDCAALIETYDLKRVLADIDADRGDRSVEFHHGHPPLG